VIARGVRPTADVVCIVVLVLIADERGFCRGVGYDETISED
jgi:hypothetical protein